MKIIRKIALIFCATILLTVSGFLILFALSTKGYEFEESKLKRGGNDIIFYAANGAEIPQTLCFNADYRLNSAEKTADELPIDLLNAFIAVEDKRFYKHCGVDFKALLRAAKNNFKSKSFKEGGSTITQQLIKNTHLSGEKTFLRKMRELKLTLQAEKKLSKNEILKYYLNTIYFGENCYGVQNAALNYFGKDAADLNLNECAALAATVKSPAFYNPRAAEKNTRKDLVLSLMLKQNLITESRFLKFYGTKPTINEKSLGETLYFSNAVNELYSQINLSPYENKTIKINTFFDEKAYENLKNKLDDYKEERAACIMQNDGEIIAEIGNVGLKRSPASTVKPLLVYAPALETKTITLATKILNERTDFSGYNPQNYGNEYGGYVNVKDCIKKSLNVPAVKILNSVGVKKAADFAKKAGVEITDLSLASALGAIGEGISVTNLCAAYSTFKNGGIYYEPKYVKKAEINGKTVYSAKAKGVRAFSEGTAALINESLNECAKDGTAKALSEKNYSVCAKTGTNGDKNGNDDAIIAAYTSKHSLVIRFSAKDGEKLNNYVTGGYAAKYASTVFDDLYSNYRPDDFKKTDQVLHVDICKSAYEDGKILLADDNAPAKYVLNFAFLKGSEPKEKSTEFSAPEILSCNLTAKNGKVTICVDRKKFVCCKIIRNGSGGAEIIAELKGGENLFVDEPKEYGSYSYAIIPYSISARGNVVYGEEINAGSVMLYDEFTQSEWWNY